MTLISITTRAISKISNPVTITADRENVFYCWKRTGETPRKKVWTILDICAEENVLHPTYWLI